MLVRLFYVSVVSDSLTDVDIQVIMGASQMKNRRLDLTGMLVQTDRHFLQIIEGRQGAVAQLMASVLNDGRHSEVRQVLEQPITRRAFAQWAMGLCRRDDLANDLERLHATSTLDEPSANELVARLLRG